ncbi:MAG TPA: hypothetical protein VMV94_19235 [Phycisphaerae bacterium]|nr:hypothetical protein [Phycisphaerae bacterium]
MGHWAHGPERSRLGTRRTNHAPGLLASPPAPWPTDAPGIPARISCGSGSTDGRNRPSYGYYNLRTAKLLIDLRCGVIFIDEDSGRTGEFPIVWMRRRTREQLAYYLLLAALSTYQASDLPDDKLLG